MTPSLILSIQMAWWEQGSSTQIAQKFTRPDRIVTRPMVERAWARGRESGHVPKIRRPDGGPNLEALLARNYDAQAYGDFIPPITEVAA